MTLKNLGSKHGDAIWIGQLLCVGERQFLLFFFGELVLNIKPPRG